MEISTERLQGRVDSSLAAKLQGLTSAPLHIEY